jgi:hypothetical protein
MFRSVLNIFRIPDGVVPVTSQSVAVREMLEDGHI